MIIKEQVVAAQKEWGAGIVKIGALKDNRAECEAFTSEFLDKLYAFDKGVVLQMLEMCSRDMTKLTMTLNN